MAEIDVIRERFVDGVFVREWGDAEAPGVLCWPGLGFTSAYFYGIADALPGRVIAMDPPGFGRSPELDWEAYELPSLAALAARVLDATGAVAFVGHSIGANVALLLAVAPPESLRACVLVDGGYMSLGARMKLGAPVFADRNAAIEFARAAVSEHGSWEEAFAELRTYFENWTPAAELATRDAFREVDGRIRESASVEGSAAMLFALRGHDPVRRAREIAVPTLLIVNGRPDGRAVRAPEWERFAAASPLVDLHVGDDWGHHPFQQAPEESGRVVGDWLRAHL